MDKKKVFSFLDWEFEKFPENLLDKLGWFCLTSISEHLALFAHVPEEDADEWAYEWATQAKYSKYLEPM